MMVIRSYFNRFDRWVNGATKRRLLIWSVGFWVISILVLGLIFLQLGQKQTLNETTERNLQLASSLSRDLNAQINSINETTRTFSQHLEALGPDLYNQADALLSLRLSTNRFNGLYYFDSQGTLLLHVTDTTANLLKVKSPEEIVNTKPITPRREIVDAYSAVKANSISFSEVYFLPFNYTPVLNIGMQIDFSDSAPRILIFEVDLTDLWQGIETSSVGQTGLTYAVSREGIIIAHPVPAYIGKETPTEIKALLNGYQGSSQFIDPITSEEVFVAYSPVRGSTAWGIVVQQDRTEIYNTIYKTWLTILLILGSLGLIGTLGILTFISSFTKPIKQLTQTTQDIANTGNLTKTGMTQRPDEVGQLSQAFDQMIERVKDSNTKLASSEARYRSLFEEANDTILLLDEHGIIDCNHKSEELFGVRREQILDKMLANLSPKIQPDGLDSYSKEKELIARALSGPAISLEWQIEKINGDLVDTELGISLLNIYGSPVLMAIVRDISERKQAEKALKKAYDEMETRVEQRTIDLKKANMLLHQEITQRQETENLLHLSELKYRDLVENSASIILEMDTKGNVTFINRFGQEFFGYSQEEIVGRNVIGTIVPQLDSEGGDVGLKIAEVVEHPELHENNENENMKRNGERVWIAWTNRGIYDKEGKLLEIHSIGIDRTVQIKAAAIQQQKVKEEAASLERTRLARDLHDAVSQTLFSASIIADVLPRLWEKNQDEGRRRLEEIRQLTRGALAEMRTLLFELRPAALADAELAYLLHQLAESITGRTRMPVKVHVEGHCDLPADYKVALYRITQEALNNVAKHANATGANIDVICQSDRTTLVISDNGKGFDVSNVRPENLGLAIMRDRAQEIGADIEIQSTIGAGSRITVSIKET